MIKRQLLGFLARWVLSSFGMWICITLFGKIYGENSFWLFILAGLIFSVVNSLVRPLMTLMALPLIVFTMGLFTLIINIAVVGLAIWLTPDVSMDFMGALLSSLVMSLVNGVVNFWISPYTSK
ncbi:phage holin family protein [Candidatus Saccharibacteria bacterium]|nr:phage holin family protein [Candidatus Saccharibacteria bacterium]